MLYFKGGIGRKWLNCLRSYNDGKEMTIILVKTVRNSSYPFKGMPNYLTCMSFSIPDFFKVFIGYLTTVYHSLTSHESQTYLNTNCSCIRLISLFTDGANYFHVLFTILPFIHI